MTMNKTQVKIQGLLKKTTRLESEDSHLLSLIRKELENLDEKEITDFSDLKLFCDWALHNKIDRSAAGSRLVAKIHETIHQVKTAHTDHVISEASKTLLLPFSEQLRAFLTDRNLPTAITDDAQAWRHFLRNIFQIVEQVPICIKSKDEDTLKDSPLKTGMWVNELTIIKVDFSALDMPRGSSIGEIYCLHILTSDTTKIIIPLTPAI